MIYRIFPFFFLLFSSFSSNPEIVSDKAHSNLQSVKVLAENITLSAEAKAVNLYNSLDANNLSLPNLESFTKALKGFYALQTKGKIQKNILTLIDFSLSSNTKRLWIIDLNSNTVLFNSLVAHGRNTGNEFATSFSNKAESYKSSLGFYATGEVYQGKHGLSLRLDGLERGVNDNARARAVVMHGADYVAESFIKNNSRLGRSLGCPAIPMNMTKEIISIIKDKSCLYIYHPSLDKENETKHVS
ncbi:murein L,D-transpeptidase catalytic domain family protein [Flavobacterium sp. SM2513]|uniref:murein L,D-transpeptidase catalytic domain family protein n=1 Tax=Flavobacterium sp. SM2513 TaxID=3424766 RepID=UPI003D7FDE6A